MNVGLPARSSLPTHTDSALRLAITKWLIVGGGGGKVTMFGGGGGEEENSFDDAAFVSLKSIKKR